MTVTVTLTTGTLWTVPSSVPAGTVISVQNWGAGSGGSGGTSHGAGGAGGAFAKSNYTVTPNDVANGVAYLIGSGSAGVGAANSTPGGATTFSTNNLNLQPNTTNAGAVTGVIGSGGSLPTGWAVGGSETGVAVSVIGFGTDPSTGFPYIDVKFAGTTTATSIDIGFNTVASTVSDPYTLSLSSALVGGSNTNIADLFLCWNELNSGTYVTTQVGTGFLPTSTTVSRSTFEAVVGATSNQNAAFLAVSYVSGVAINATYRIAGLQFEQAASASFYKSTPGYTSAAGGGIASGTTGATGGQASASIGSVATFNGGNGANFNASGAGGGGAGGPSGAGANGTTAGVGGTADNGSGGTGGAVKATSPGNAGAANANGGGGGGGLKTVTGTAGAGGAPGGGGGGADASTGTGGAGATGQILIVYTISPPRSDSLTPTDTYAETFATVNVALSDAIGNGFTSGFSSGFGNGQASVLDTYTVSAVPVALSDTIGPTDSYASSAIANLAFSDQFTLSPVYAAIFTPLMFANLSLPETAAATDSYSDSASPGLSETAAATDSYAALAIGHLALTDTISLSDTYAASGLAAEALADTIAATDGYVPSAIANLALSDTAAVTDGYAALDFDHLALSDTAAATDIYAEPGITLALSDTVALSELYAGLGLGPEPALSDTVAPSDTYAAPASPGISDTAAATDAYAAILAVANSTLSDTLPATDAYTLLVATLILSDTLSVTDEFDQSASSAYSLPDTLSPTDVFVFAGAGVFTWSDSLAPSDSYAETASPASASWADTLSLVDTYFDLLPGEFADSWADNLSPSDSFASTAAVMAASINETPTVSDSFSEAIIASGALGDTLSPADTYGPAIAISALLDILAAADEYDEIISITALSLPDSLSVTDVYLAPGIGQFAFSLSDSLAASDTYASVSAIIPLSINDNPSVSDVFKDSAAVVEALSDSLSPSDSFVSPSAIMPAAISETVSPSDTYAEASATLPTVSVSDIVSPADTYAEQGTASLSLPETTAPTDSFASFGVAVALTDTLSPSDTYGYTTAIEVAALLEIVPAVDFYNTVSTIYVYTVADTLSGSDSYLCIGPPALPFAFSDNLDISDELDIFVIPPNLFALGLSDNLMPSDGYANGPTLDIVTPHQPVTGGGVFTAVPLRFSDMAPGDISPFNFDFLSAGWTTSQDPVASAVVSTSAPTDLRVIGGPGVQSSGVTVWLSGGTANTDYEIYCRVTTQFGRQVTRTAHVYVDELVPA